VTKTIPAGEWTQAVSEAALEDNYTIEVVENDVYLASQTSEPAEPEKGVVIEADGTYSIESDRGEAVWLKPTDSNDAQYRIASGVEVRGEPRRNVERPQDQASRTGNITSTYVTDSVNSGTTKSIPIDSNTSDSTEYLEIFTTAIEPATYSTGDEYQIKLKVSIVEIDTGYTHSAFAINWASMPLSFDPATTIPPNHRIELTVDNPTDSNLFVDSTAVYR
jgi:hypothetical protein